MRQLLVATLLAVIVLALVAVMTPSSSFADPPDCPFTKGKGKKQSCDYPEPPPCPPCQEFDYCKCRCQRIPGCNV